MPSIFYVLNADSGRYADASISSTVTIDCVSVNEN